MSIPTLLATCRSVDTDLLGDYGSGGMSYEEFAARVRRRADGMNKDFDPGLNPVSDPASAGLRGGRASNCLPTTRGPPIR